MKTPLILIITLSLTNFAIGQIDSAWIKGELILEDGYYQGSKTSIKNPVILDKYETNEFYFVDTTLLIGLDAFQNITIDINNFNRNYISIKLKDDFNSKWAKVTQMNIGQYLLLVINNQLIQASLVNAEITNGVSAINREGLGVNELNSILNLIEEKIK